MSGIEAGLAIAGCVFGAIQAYDAAERTVKRIKDRRQARKAPAPSVFLEKSLEQGKQELERLVATGRERFGQTYLSEVDEGDIVVQNALLQITNQTLIALINRLSEARDDDTVVDFSDCIDAADSGRIRASIALNGYFLRKQEEALRSSAAINSKNDTPKVSVKPTVFPAETPKVSATEIKIGDGVASKAVTATESAPPTSRRTRTFPFIFKIHSRTASQQSSISTATTLLEPAPPDGDRPVFSNRPEGNAVREATEQAPSRPLPYTNRFSGTSSSSSNTGRSSTASSRSPRSFASRRTSFSSEAQSTVFQADVAPITIYGGCCKSAYLLREGKQSNALTRKETSLFGTPDKHRTFVWACSTHGCEFEGPAFRNAKKHIIIDDRIRKWGDLRYTWMFLAKSHATRKDPKAAVQYRCVFCNLFGVQSEFFRDHNELLSHVTTHTGSCLGCVKLEGGVVVSNYGLTVDTSFDIDFPLGQAKVPPLQRAPTPPNSMDASKRSSLTLWSEDIDVEKNHWA